MNVRQLINELEKFDGDLLVMHSTGTMQDTEEVTNVILGRDSETHLVVAWDKDLNRLTDGKWVFLG